MTEQQMVIALAIALQGTYLAIGKFLLDERESIRAELKAAAADLAKLNDANAKIAAGVPELIARNEALEAENQRLKERFEGLSHDRG